MFGGFKLFTIKQWKIKPAGCFISTRFLFTNLALLLSFASVAQLDQHQRLEIPIKSIAESFEVIPVNEFGILMYRRYTTPQGDQFEITYSDTTFQEKWKGFLAIDLNYRLIRQATLREKVYMVFQHRNMGVRDMHIYEINTQTGNYTKFIAHNTISFFPTSAVVTSKGLLLGGYFLRVPLVVFFNFSTQQSRILPGLMNETGELTHVKVNSDDSFDVIISARNYQKQQTIWVKNYNADGGLIRNVMLKADENNLVFGRTIETGNNSQLVVGVYGSRNTEYSRGIFIARIDAEGDQKIEYYKFAEMENFFKFMRARQEVRMKNKIARKKINGKKIRLQYRFIVHELTNYNNQIVLLGEAFFPRYRYYEGGYMGTYRASNTAIFDGYQYTHAVILGISPSGVLEWDNSFEINDVRTFTLDQFVKMDPQEKEIALLYLYNNQIRTKLIQNNTVVEGKTYNPLQMKFNEEAAPDPESTINKLDYWYNDYFLAYGVTNVLPAGTNGKGKRKKVFFINKLRYR